MLKKIESIRQKPKEVRNRYAFWSAFGFTAIIAVFWVVSLPSHLSVFTDSSPSVESENVQGGIARSFSELRASLSEGVDAFKQIKEEVTPVEEEAPDIQKIDFETFFSTSTPEATEVDVPARQVLIGTSTSQTSEADEG